ncbi:ThuA domain-containing protein [Micromonospora sp. STR1s_6]|uniref:ThuA domain-containing protein n=1 Tax=Micromonospora tarensis TaxID=2806100 RepID=A0ABS1YJX4_9ACTN|nr:ThuA domain-containing protein [Micromonospora tarensis]
MADAARAQVDSTWFTGLIGTRPAGAIPVAEPVARVTASGENPPNETKEKLTDEDANTKWLVRTPTAWVAYELSAPKRITGYALTSANDSAGRDPKDWTLQGSTDGQSWTDLDRRTGQTFPDRFQTRRFDIATPQEFSRYRLNVTANSGEPLVQLADLRLFTGSTTAPEPPAVNRAVVNILDRKHPATASLPLTLTRSDRWENWDPNPIGSVHTLAQVEERHYNAGASANGPFHPVSWCRDYDGGRSFYTGMGHTEGSYGEEAFRAHLAGALNWTTGRVRGDCQATIAANYKVERLTAANQTGQLDQIGEPHGLTIAPDGTVFYVGKAACPSGPIADWNDPKVGLGCGTIHSWDPRTKQAKLLTTLEVMGNRGSGSELVKNEEGLLGIVPDPKFAENGWLYVYWMPHESVDRVKRVVSGPSPGSPTTVRRRPSTRPPVRICCSSRCRCTAAATPVAVWRSTPRATSTSAPATTTPPRARRATPATTGPRNTRASPSRTPAARRVTPTTWLARSSGSTRRPTARTPSLRATSSHRAPRRPARRST